MWIFYFIWKKIKSNKTKFTKNAKNISDSCGVFSKPTEKKIDLKSKNCERKVTDHRTGGLWSQKDSFAHWSDKKGSEFDESYSF